MDDAATDPGLDPTEPLASSFRSAIDNRIESFLAAQGSVVAELGREFEPLLTLARSSLSGGKRLRPAFCVWGYVAAAGLPGGDGRPDGLLDAAASLELLHVSALVHDDVMDSSDLRRGQPAAHRWLEQLHRRRDWLGDPEAYGRAGAILLGDLLLMWSTEMLRRAAIGADRSSAAQAIAEVMRTEVTGGQFLDVSAQARPLSGGVDLDQALVEANRVLEFKSARYSVQRPAQLGAAIGGGSPELHATLADYGSALGRAFQLRDDLLGVFGDPAVTGKPAGDDLREGKRTVLVAYAFAHAEPSGRQIMSRLLGDPDLDADGVARLQQLIADVGARESVEKMIDAGYDQALLALDVATMTTPGRTALTALAELAVRRSA